LSRQSDAGGEWQPLEPGAELCRQDSVRTGPLSRAALSLVNEAVLRLDQDTTIRLADVSVEETSRSFIDLVFGAFESFSRKPKEIDVNAPHMVLAVRGTEFLVRADAEQSLLSVQEGEVVASNPSGQLSVAGGSAAVARAGQAPQPFILIHPRDAVQWTLHYPAVLTLPAPAEGGTDPAWLQLARGRDTAGALDALEREPGADRDASVQLYRAALLLDVGRVDEARGAIDRALELDAASGSAYALRSIIDVAQNRNAEALVNAERAVELNPKLAAPWIALSYARQGQFQLEAARDALLQAVAAQPQDALAWARLAEVRLMLGDRRGAREDAARAEQLAPDTARVYSVRGFADLTEFRTRDARAAFDRALALDSSDPLPRFGLGLARIRDGQLQEGRADIETAVGLSPQDALLRTYLGKSYFEEKRDDLASQQYGIAKQLDPLDPTAYLYDAILKQTENRPVEALKDLETSIELNNNRAVYRSRLALDEDRAARGTSLARIFDDLGFDNLGQTAASQSLTLDPGNAGAHRFLSDIYRNERRRETARVSELLQSQLLQDININPIQPSLSETNLNIVTQGGPARPGYSEFTPLFERNQFQVNGSAVIGNNSTRGGEAVASALYDRYSISAGAFHYDTHGWRPNGDINHDIYDVLFQAALTPELNAQLEYRRRDSQYGDLAQNWDPDDFSPNETNKLHQDIARVGLRYSPAAHSNFLLSYVYSDRDQKGSDSVDLPFGTLNTRTSGRDAGSQGDAQYQFKSDLLNVIAGGGLTRLNGDQSIEFDLFGIEEQFDDETHYGHGYIYGNLNLPAQVTWTLGVSYDDYELEPTSVEKVNPKVGVQWDLSDRLKLRAAAFQVVKPPLAGNQTIEPTQVAGFNQFYDDTNGTVARRYGVGADWKLASGLYAGAEASWRNLDLSYVGVGDNDELTSLSADGEEQTHRLYLNWAPRDDLALTSELVYDRFQTPESDLTIQTDYPEDLKTISLPLWARYFHPSGFFAGFGTTFVHQEVKRSAGNLEELDDGTDSFVLFDAFAGYRLPKRFGVVSLSINNIFDKNFDYQDDSFREFQDAPSVGPYIPSRQILLQVSLSW
jgi:tetratricopeptide (TPR) repeat protein